MRKPILRVQPYLHSDSHPWVIEGHRTPDGKRKRLFFRTEKDADEELAKIKKRLEHEGKSSLLLPDALRVEAIQCAEKLKPHNKSLTQAVDHLIAHLKRTERSCTVEELATALHAAKKQDGKSKAYLLDLAKRVKRFVETFGARTVSDIEPREIDDWLRAIQLSPKSRNNFRANVGVLFSYAVDRGYIERNPIERTGKAKLVDKAPEIFTVEELTALLTHADPKILPCLAIGAFAGLRDAEISRLLWSEVNLSSGLIEVKAAKAKSARRRLVKIEKNLKRWLTLTPHAKRKGPVTPPNSRKKEEAARAAAELERWPNNGLRHSFASYHVARFGDAARTAMELGHATPQMLFSNYRELVTPKEAKKYWKIVPAPRPTNIIPLPKPKPETKRAASA